MAKRRRVWIDQYGDRFYGFCQADLKRVHGIPGKVSSMYMDRKDGDKIRTVKVGVVIGNHWLSEFVEVARRMRGRCDLCGAPGKIRYIGPGNNPVVWSQLPEPLRYDGREGYWFICPECCGKLWEQWHQNARDNAGGEEETESEETK